MPTDNTALLQGNGPDFYMYTDRTFEGVRSAPWQGGQYGFVRNQERARNGSVVFTRFHEGLDIQPTERDGRGEPLDEVRSVDQGRVVYVNRSERASSYGRYVVVEHWWQGAPYYTLYGHLSDVTARTGAEVGRGERIGRIGYTGTGIDRRRAHLHFEVNLYLSDLFESWYGANYSGANQHGRYHGINLSGIDASALLIAFERDPYLILGDLIQRVTPAAYTVRVPGGYVPELVSRYAWMAPEASTRNPPRAWDIEIAQSGQPISFRAVDEATNEPRVVLVAEAVSRYENSTNRMITRDRNAASGFALTKRGLSHLRLLTMPVAGSSDVAW